MTWTAPRGASTSRRPRRPLLLQVGSVERGCGAGYGGDDEAVYGGDGAVYGGDGCCFWRRWGCVWRL
eukprot:2368198-Rhodomonas_salina.1